ncbi:MAG: Spy/CpxP family protein refolding chaperone [Ilyomonas sp.]
MKKIMMLVCAAILSVAVVHAQDSTSMRKHNHSRFDNRQKRNDFSNLNLTQDQKDQFQKIRQESRVEREKIRNDSSLSQEQKEAKMKDLQKQDKEKFSRILTDEQKAKLKEEKAQKKDYYKKRKESASPTK